MGNKFEMMPEPVKNEEAPEDVVDGTGESEKIVEEGQESKPEGEVVSNAEEHEGEMEEEEEKVAAEMEAKFRNGLALLHARIQIARKSKEEFPDKDELAKLVDITNPFDEMAEGAKRKFLDALSTVEEFRSDDDEVFIEKGMEIEIVGLLIHTAMLKQVGDARLKRKEDEINRAVA